MVISDSYSDKTSSTLPIIISFSSHLKTNKIKQIRDILSHHPNCQKYVTKGPNFVADGINEFRLYYVDSSLYSDEITLKRLNVEKEEIVFGNTSQDSLEPIYNLSKKKELHLLYSDENSDPTKIPKTYDKVTIGTQRKCKHSRCDTSVIETPRVINKVSKSFQIGPDLRFNVVYVNTDVPQHSFNYKTTEASVQTEQVKTENTLQVEKENTQKVKNGHNELESSEVIYNLTANSSMEIPIRDSPSFLFGSQGKPEKKKLTTFKTFCSKMEEKRVFKFTDDSEFNVESRTTSVKYSIKKSPSFLANYILEILNTRTSHDNILSSEIFKQSVANYIKIDNFNNRFDAKTTNELGMKNDIFKYNRKSPHKSQVIKKNKHAHRKKSDKVKQNNKYSKSCNYIDKLSRYHNNGKSTCCKVECLFKCANMDFFLRRSHYAILKKYHRKLEEKRQKREKHHHHNHRHRNQKENSMDKNENYNRNEYNMQNRKFVVHTRQEIPHHKKIPSGDSKTKTTISAFLHSYRPWHWRDNSKLSLCIDEECVTG